MNQTCPARQQTALESTSSWFTLVEGVKTIANRLTFFFQMVRPLGAATLLLAAGSAVLLFVVVAHQLASLRSPKTEDPLRVWAALLREAPSLSDASIEYDPEMLPKAPELLEAKWSLPNTDLADPAILRLALEWTKAEESCDTGKLKAVSWTGANSARPRGHLQKTNFDRWTRWIETICRWQGSPLPPEFLDASQLIHPLGGSWARYIEKSARQKAIVLDTESLDRLRPYRHILELDWPERLKPAAVVDIVAGRPYAITSHDIWISGRTVSFALPHRTLDRWMASRGWTFNATDACRSAYRFSDCLKPARLKTNWAIDHQAQLLFLSAGLLLIGLGMMVYRDYQNRNRDEQSRRLVLQTLAHELRHPTTSFQLSLEVLRDQFDELPSQSQTEFLRMIDQLQRLKKVLDASRQYLEAHQQGEAFIIARHHIEDGNAYIESLLEPYRKKLALELPEASPVLNVDRYWFGLCVTNLVKNALIHGAKPIRVRLSDIDDGVRLDVSDNGLPAELSFAEMIQPMRKGKSSPGMGLGLSMVHRLMQLMDGELSYSANPKTFSLIVRTDT